MSLTRFIAVRCLVFAASCFLIAGCQGPTGAQGEPCSVKDNGNGTATITCPDGTTTDIASGANGTSCTLTVNADAGTKTITCGTTVITITDGKNGVDANSVVDFATLTSAELAVLDMSIKVHSISNDAKPVVSFTVRDLKGRGVKAIPPANFSGFALMQLVPGDISNTGNGLNVDTWVSHITNCATCTASTETASSSTLVDNGDGSYRYTFQKDIKATTPFGDGGQAVAGVAFDDNAPHKFGMRLAASGNPFRPVDAVFEYLPATGADVTGQNDKVSTAACLVCHMQWRANALNAGGTIAFHSGQRYEAQYCVVCHNNQRKYLGNLVFGNAVIGEPVIDSNTGDMTPTTQPTIDGGVRTNIPVVRGEAVIDMPVFVHKLHMGHELFLKGAYAGMGTEMNKIEFPQSPAYCISCHKSAAKADNWKNKVSRRACGACHDKVDFVTGANHGPGGMAGAQDDDTGCMNGACHTAAKIAAVHLAVDAPNPAATWLGGTTNSTHASWVGNVDNPPPGAIGLKYQMPSKAVTAIDAGNGNVYAKVQFRFVYAADGGAVVFNSSADAGELLDNFVGAPSIYCAYAVPQDDIEAPADFNASVSGYLRKLWKGDSTGTLSGPTSGYYTATLTTPIPGYATMLTCGVGFSYSLSSTPPMVQTNLSDFPWMLPDGGTSGGKVPGGLALPPPNVWQVAQGYTGRRGSTSSSSSAGQIVLTAKCNACHNPLGVWPTFHAGQRNDGPSCSWCHTQNRTSSGWSAGSENFVHAIHGAGKRTVPFNWHSLSEEEGFWEVAYPGRPQMCEGCHQAGYYDFSASWYTEERLATRLFQTVAGCTPSSSSTTCPNDGGPCVCTYDGASSTAYMLSPYVNADNSHNYGATFWFDAPNGVLHPAEGDNLVNSPISNVCFGCHDAERSVQHMKSNGGAIYGQRASYISTVEQCLVCHGPGKIAAIKAVHYQ